MRVPLSLSLSWEISASAPSSLPEAVTVIICLRDARPPYVRDVVPVEGVAKDLAGIVGADWQVANRFVIIGGLLAARNVSVRI